MKDFLKGKKTYILAAAGAFLTFINLMGLLDAETYKALMALVVPAAAVSLRAGVEKSGS